MQSIARSMASLSVSRRLPLLILILILIAQVITHLGWLSISTQSGQMIVPWLMNRGGTLFRDVFESRAPGNAVILTVIQAVSPFEPVVTLRLANVLLIMAITVMIFLAARKLMTASAGMIAVLVWFWWEPVYGNILFYFDTLLGCVFVLVVLLLLRYEKHDWRTYFITGLLLGGTILIKQHALPAPILFGAWLLVRRVYFRDLVIYTVGVLTLPLLVIGVTAAQGTLDAYLFWNWSINLSSVRPGSPLTGNFIRKLLLTIIFVPPFALILSRMSNRSAATALLILWVAANANLFPNFGEIYVMAQLPLVAIMSGVVIAVLLPSLLQRPATIIQQGLAGFLIIIVVGWLWTGAVAYVPALGRAATLAYDEFKPVAEQLNAVKAAGETLYVLPEYDGSSQLHILTDLPPPGSWTNGHRWFLAARGVVDSVLAEWAETPPTYIVYFPELAQQTQPYIDPLVDFMNAHYEEVQTVADIPFNGDAVIYRLDASS